MVLQEEQGVVWIYGRFHLVCQDPLLPRRNRSVRRSHRGHRRGELVGGGPRHEHRLAQRANTRPGWGYFGLIGDLHRRYLLWLIMVNVDVTCFEGENGVNR